jgi:hypothetical protein
MDKKTRLQVVHYLLRIIFPFLERQKVHGDYSVSMQPFRLKGFLSFSLPWQEKM